MNSNLSRFSLLTGVLFALAGCGEDSPPPRGQVKAGCTLNTDCDAGLVCTFSRCHEECASSADCKGGRCVIGDNDKHVCVLPMDDPQCTYTSMCPNPLVCAVDQKCRNQCAMDRDCVSNQICAVSGVCADLKEVDATRRLVNAVEGSGGEAGSGGAGNSPGTGNQGGDLNSGGAGGTTGVTGTGGAGAGACDGAGEPCEPTSDPCGATGVTECGANGELECVTVKAEADGTQCGAEQVCYRGQCVACAADAPCQPEENECLVGRLACDTGAPVCVASGNERDGTDCTGGVCYQGVCTPCNSGATCQLSGTENLCKVGSVDCSSGASQCLATGDAKDGKSCGVNQVCAAGECTACQPGAACAPAANPCHAGRLECQNGVLCRDLGSNVEDGFTCGENKICAAGTCTTATRTLSITSGNNQSKRVDEPLSPVVVRLVDDQGTAVTNATITLVPPSGAGAAQYTVTTNASGNATLSLRLGRQVGDYRFSVTSPGAAAVNVDAKAVAPAAGTIFSVVGANHAAGNTGVPGAGPLAQIGAPAAVTAASDGTLFIATASYCQVLKLAPDGQLSRFAGKQTGSCAYSAAEDGGLATEAGLNSPQSLAYDEASKSLYVGTQTRVMKVDATGHIVTIAGGGSAPSPAYGDGNVATEATLSPVSLSIAPDGKVVIGDGTSNRVRYVDVDTGFIQPWLGLETCSASGPLVFRGCNARDCDVVWDAAGNAFISGSFCGQDTNGSTVYGIARRPAAGGALVHVAGLSSSAGTTQDGVSARRAYIAQSAGLVSDKAGNIYYLDYSGSRVRRIESATGRVTSVAGIPQGTAGFAGDYADALTAQFYSPSSLAIDGDQNLYVADYYNYAVRAVWGVGSTTPDTAKLSMAATSSGNQQTAYADQLLPSLLRVQLEDGAGAQLTAFTVDWSTPSPGAVLSATRANANVGNSLRLGLAPGNYSAIARFTDIHGVDVQGSPVTFTATATQPPSGMVATIVNIDRASGNDGGAGPGTVAHVGQPWGIAASTDGNVYFTAYTYHNLYKLDPAGRLTRIAGVSAAGYNAGEDSGPANQAHLYYPTGLALDETNKRLYVSEGSSPVRVRVIDLQTGIINTFAGGGTTTSATWGDGAAATLAVLASAGPLAVSPNGKTVYISDGGHNVVRTVDVDSGIISTWLKRNPTCTAPGPVVEFYDCADGSDCGLAVAPNGDVYVSAYLRGSAIHPTSGCSAAYGIVKAAGGSASALTHVAGRYSGQGLTTDGAQATNTYFASIRGLARDALGNLYVSQYGSHLLRKISAADGTIATLLGNGTSGYAGDYVLASPATTQVANPGPIAIMPGGGFVFSDYTNYAIRRVW